MIFKDIDDVFGKVCENKKYPSPSYGFYCPGESCKYGDAIYPQYQHPAKCEFSDESKQMKCDYSGAPIDLTKEHKQWFPPPLQVHVTNA